MTSVSTVDPIKVYFTVGEPQYLAFRKRFPTEASTRADQKTLRIELVLADGSTYPHLGSFDFADRQVNESTGTIRIAALFPNPNNILRPGGYAKVRVFIDVQHDALLVPQRAVSELQGGYQVAVVDNDNKIGNSASHSWGSDGQPLGDLRWAQARGPGGRGRNPEGSPGHTRQSKAIHRERNG